ncbi:MAG: trypsin-like peptidase domain-containing protein [Gemmatimonadota bacterium]
MSRVTNFMQIAALACSAAFAACSDDYANAQTSGTQQQIREKLGDAPAVIDTTTAYRLSAAFRGAAARALPAVVRVSVTTEPRVAQNGQRGLPSPLERLFPGFPGFDDDPPRQRRGGRGSGSGFVFDPRGFVMTNNHVIEGADRVLVTMVDGREYNAAVVGGDPNTDVAVIKIDPAGGERLQAVEFGSSDELHVGDWVIALGNPLGLQFSVTAGIVSAKGRNLGILDQTNQGTGLEAFIQTDAVINPGNSGGPMIDLTGDVVGINSAIESPTGFWAGNGFAIPIDLARKVATDIIEFGHVRRPRLGVEVGQVTAADAAVYKLPSVAGAEITAVQPGEAAASAGIQMGDVVVSLNNDPIRSQTEFMEELARRRPGERVRLGLIRYGQRLEKDVTLGEFESAPARRTQPAERPRTERLLGFSVQQLTPQIARQLESAISSGVVVDDVDQLSSAFGNIFAGDIIRRVNNREIDSLSDLERIADSLKPGDTVTIVVRRRNRNYDTIVNYRIR